jgi:predicted GH43/DUF377 family glycosyl hydrolase
MKTHIVYLVIVTIVLIGCNRTPKKSNKESNIAIEASTYSNSIPFPTELTDFISFAENPIFTGTDSATWDQKIRERGFILKEEDTFHMWYTGFRTERKSLSLGYASSQDGISWTRYLENPIFNESWTEDMMVLKVADTYHMFAEGKGDIAHRLTSSDRINWIDHGPLDMRSANGSPLSEGPYGTPTAWFENDTWYLFYERNDLGIWLATSKDLLFWTNIQDDPVISMGPEIYDQYGLAVNQIIKYKGWYYAYYHATAYEDWHEWSTNVAASKDLLHWNKYDQNPILEENKSSGILVNDGNRFLLYTMHESVALHFQKNK